MAWLRTAIGRITWILLLAGSSARAACAANLGDDELPRYRLNPGMVLSYMGRADVRAGSDTYVEELDTTAWVIRHNPDGSWRVVFQVGSRLRRAGGPKAAKPAGGTRIPGMGYRIGYFDLFPDGRLGPQAEVGAGFDPAINFPRLPEKSATSAWSQRDPRTGEEYRYSSLRREAGGWSFRAERVGPWKKVYGMTYSATYHFERGVVVRAEQEFTQGFGGKGRSEGVAELTAMESKDAAWAATFSLAADRYIAANAAYQAAVRAASKDAANGPPLLADARKRLQAARDAIDEPSFRGEIDRMLAGHDARVRSCDQEAHRRARVVGKPSPDWTLQGLDRKPHALADYRGRVVVLDFWDRSCGWCIKAMPEMNALTGRFRGRPVTVLGMNADAREEDARFVSKAMHLEY